MGGWLHHGGKCVCVDKWECVLIKMHRLCRLRSSEWGAVFTVRVCSCQYMGVGREGVCVRWQHRSWGGVGGGGSIDT